MSPCHGEDHRFESGRARQGHAVSVASDRRVTRKIFAENPRVTLSYSQSSRTTLTCQKEGDMPPKHDKQPDDSSEPKRMVGLVLVKAQMLTFPQLPRLWDKISSQIGGRKLILDVDGDSSTRISLTLELNLDLFEQLLSELMPDEVKTSVTEVVSSIKKLMTSSKPVETGVFLQSSDLSDLIYKLGLLEDLLKKY